MMAMPPTTSPVAVEIGDASPKVVADLQVADVLQVHRLPGLVAAEHEEFELVQVLGVHAPRSWYSRLVTSMVRPPASWNAP